MDELAGKKILFVITKSNWGGAQQYVYTLATRFKEAGADTAVAFGGTGEAGASAGILEARLKDAGVRTIFLKSFARDVSVAREYSAFFELLRVLRTEKPDVIHLNSSKAGGLGALAGRLSGIRRIVFTAHGFAHREPRPLHERGVIWVLSWLTALLSHRVIIVSEDDMRHAPVFFSRQNMVMVPNGISPFPLLPRSEARAALSARAESASGFPFWFLTLSELHPNKGLDTLIRAFAEAAREMPHAALVLINDGQSRAGLSELARTNGCADRVFFAGFVPNARELLSAADVFVLPSRKEGLPFAILEAGMARLPVIATRVGAVPEIVEDGVSGLLVPAGEAGPLAEALLRMENDALLRARAGNALHARVIRGFSEEAMLRKTALAYR